jgi:hypothetical protein
MLVGWIDDQAAPALLRRQPPRAVEAKSMIMVRAPVRIEPAEVGSKVSVPAALVRIDTGKLPYDRQTGESVPSQEQGQWLMSMTVPREIGEARPTRLTLDLRVALPAHTLSLHKGQCAGGTPKPDLNGAVVGEWSREVGARQVVIDCAPGDYDRSGRAWLLLEVRSSGAPGGAAPWQIKDLAATVEAEVVAPPKPIDLEPPPQEPSHDE